MNGRSLLIARSVAVIGGTAALVVGATFAASVGTVSLTGNTFAASQGLQISNGGVYGDTATGFDFGTAPIGSTGSAKQNFFLKDISGAASPLAISVAGANCGGFAGLNKDKVHVNIEKDGGTIVDSPSLTDLCGGSGATLDTTNSPELAGVGTKYNVWITLDAGAITGATNPASDGFDLNFTGTES
ncbi:MAG TPA: hypothetical protein VHQ86_05650 [Candidatus Saccharimonadia bacterium]|jgi:hypothetical protein|nr:hypothetical protein [Candidatus Saccharimonadia bacterium]